MASSSSKRPKTPPECSSRNTPSPQAGPSSAVDRPTHLLHLNCPSTPYMQDIPPTEYGEFFLSSFPFLFQMIIIRQSDLDY